MLIFLARHLDDKVTVKQLLASVPYSDTGIRIYFEDLLKRGLIELEESPADRRVRYVKATDELRKEFTKWAESGSRLLEDITF